MGEGQVMDYACHVKWSRKVKTICFLSVPTVSCMADGNQQVLHSP